MRLIVFVHTAEEEEMVNTYIGKMQNRIGNIWIEACASKKLRKDKDWYHTRCKNSNSEKSNSDADPEQKVITRL